MPFYALVRRGVYHARCYLRLERGNRTNVISSEDCSVCLPISHVIELRLNYPPIAFVRCIGIAATVSRVSRPLLAPVIFNCIPRFYNLLHIMRASVEL